MMIRVEQEKERKDRYTLLSKRVLQELRDNYKEYRPKEWLFPAQRNPTRHLSVDAVQRACYAAPDRVGLSEGSFGKIKCRAIHTLRHCFETYLLEAGVD